MAKIIENKDLNLKMLCKLLFKSMGYVTHYEIQLRTKSYINTFKTHDISDIDVYGYKFNSDLSFNSIGSECKSGETSALEELFKFDGVVKYYGLDKGYLIKTRIHQNARHIAIKSGFRCFTEAEIRQLLLGMDIDVEKHTKIENAKFYRLKSSLISFKKNNEKLVDYITLDYWNRENWRNIHNLIHLLKTPVNQELFEEDSLKISDKFIHYYVLELFALSVLKCISSAMILNYSDIFNSITETLYGGAESLHERRRIYDLVSQATQNNVEFEPSWQQDLIHILIRYANSTLPASVIPLMIQDFYENSFYDNKIKVEKSFLSKYPDTTRKFIQDLIQFLVKHCDVDSKIFEEFMAL